VSTPEIQVYTNEGENFSFMTEFAQQASFQQAEQISTIDGLRVDFKHGWGLVRPSNTTPCLVLRFEADNEANLKEIQQQFRLQMLAINSHLQLPF